MATRIFGIRKASSSELFPADDGVILFAEKHLIHETLDRLAVVRQRERAHVRMEGENFHVLEPGDLHDELGEVLRQGSEVRRIRVETIGADLHVVRIRRFENADAARLEHAQGLCKEPEKALRTEGAR